MFQKFYFLFSCNWVLNQWVLWKCDRFLSETMLLSSNIHLGPHYIHTIRSTFFFVHITTYLPVVTLIWCFIAHFFWLVRSHIYSEFKFVPSVSIPSANFSPWFFTCFSGHLWGYLLRSTVPSRGFCETPLVISICLQSFSIPLPIYCYCFQPFTWFFVHSRAFLLVQWQFRFL